MQRDVLNKAKLYRVIKKSLCTLCLQYNRQVHRAFLITLYYCATDGNGVEYMNVEHTALEFAHRATVLKLLGRFRVRIQSDSRLYCGFSRCWSGGEANCRIADDVSQTEPELVARQWVGRSRNCGLIASGAWGCFPSNRTGSGTHLTCIEGCFSAGKSARALGCTSPLH
jgi:hypothetical protein